MNKLREERITLLVNSIRTQAPPCPDPDGGGCMGGYCIRCAANELRPLLREELKIPLEEKWAEGPPPFEYMPMTGVEKVIWATVFGERSSNHGSIPYCAHGAYVAVKQFRGQEAEEKGSRECELMYEEMRAPD